KSGQWNAAEWLPHIAPTTHDDEGNAQTNPHFNMLTRGTVHDPTTRRMGGVAGHAGVFSTGHDVALFASALLEKLLHNTGPFPVKQSTLQLMVAPEQPGHSPKQIIAAQKATDAQIAAGEKGSEPGLAPHYPAIAGQDLRGYGWDIDTAFSKPRGMIFPIGSFGHTGYTGTTLWMDAASDTYVVLLTNAVHSHTGKPISNLRGEVATAVAQALGLGKYSFDRLKAGSILSTQPHVLTGIDVLEADHFTELKTLAAVHSHHLTLGILTNQTGLDAHGNRTLDQLNALSADNIHLTTIFSPEHGIFGKQDTTAIAAEVDPTTHIAVTSLYGVGAAARHPKHEQLQNLDAVVIDIQDLGVHYWTYESTVAYFLEASDTEMKKYHHRLDVVLLDRPNPIGGIAMQGPVVDADHTSYVAYMPIPVRHGLTIGEFARYVVVQKHLDTALTVIPLRGWQRSMFYAETGVPWVKPSPNMPTPEAAILYPALGEIEGTNISVGRGTTHPFSFFGAGVPSATKSNSTATGGLGSTEISTAPYAWFHAKEVADYLAARHILGVTFTPTKEAIAEDHNHYPFHGQTIEAVHVTCTDPAILDTPELGIEIASALHKLYPDDYHVARLMNLINNRATVDAVERGDDPRAIQTAWQPALATYRASIKSILLY
ncbi:MAG: exo-beta-N-acetylmuramidase NamZ domain-containing protein, partial [Bryocella sp.]